MQFIDSHCHVHFEAYKDDMHEVVQRTLDAGVHMVTIGTQTTTSRNAVALAEQYDGVWATIGLHPNHLHAQEFHDHDELPEADPNPAIKTRSESFNPNDYIDLIAHPKVVAVGELGLDYYRIPEGLEADTVKADQKKEALAQIEFASQHNKPIIVHCRDAHEDQHMLLKDVISDGGLQRRGVIHSFTGTAKDAERYRELNFKLGLNGILLFSKDLQKHVKGIPLEQLMIETDAPYLTPPPHRGKRNEPQYVKIIAEFLADLKGVNIEAVAEMTTSNSKELFQI